MFLLWILAVLIGIAGIVALFRGFGSLFH